MIRFDMTAAVTTATPVVLRLYLNTDNPNYYNRDGAEPTIENWLLGFALAVDNPVKVEIGMCNLAKDQATFVPAYTILATKAIAGGEIRKFDGDQVKLAFNDSTFKYLALRLTVTANATINVAGDIEHGRV